MSTITLTGDAKRTKYKPDNGDPIPFIAFYGIVKDGDLAGKDEPEGPLPCKYWDGGKKKLSDFVSGSEFEANAELKAFQNDEGDWIEFWNIKNPRRNSEGGGGGGGGSGGGGGGRVPKREIDAAERDRILRWCETNAVDMTANLIAELKQSNFFDPGGLTDSSVLERAQALCSTLLIQSFYDVKLPPNEGYKKSAADDDEIPF